MSFSERQGLRAPRTMVQMGEMDDPLKNSLWNVVDVKIWAEDPNRQWRELKTSTLIQIIENTWANHFKKPLDRLPRYTVEALNEIRVSFYESPYGDSYDLLEFLAGACREWDREDFMAACNAVMARELGGYRFLGGILVPISDTSEVQSVEDAISNTASLRGAQSHIRTALGLLADRENPDFRNSIKESISAVEATCQMLTDDPKATLGQALKLIGPAGVHPALRNSLSSLYGYTNDADGIRHAMLEESSLTFTDAKFMLVSCTAFINYLLGKAAEKTP